MIGFLNTNIPDPVAFSIFGTDIMWYGIIIAVAILIAIILCYKRAPKHGIPPEKVLDAMIFCIPAAIVGARLYYVAFNFGDYGGDFLKIINLRLGGLAIHGALIAAFIVGLIFCRINKIGPMNGFDLAVPCIAIGQAIGRWGNYFNSEAHGVPTNLPWGIPVGGQLVHPTFLYESLWCLILFFILILIDDRRAFDGQTFLSYGILYSAERFFVEGLRTDSLMLGALRQAQVLSVVIFIASITAMIILWGNSKPKGRIFFRRRNP